MLCRFTLRDDQRVPPIIIDCPAPRVGQYVIRRPVALVVIEVNDSLDPSMSRDVAVSMVAAPLRLASGNA